MTAPQTPAEVRRQLLRGGFTPLPLYGKAPVIEAWHKRHDTTEHEIKSWSRMHPAAQNTGILTRLTPTLDIDILNSDAAAAVNPRARSFRGQRPYPRSLRQRAEALHSLPNNRGLPRDSPPVGRCGHAS